RVVLVDHQPVEPHLVGELVLVEIALVVLVGDVGREEGVGEGEAQRGILVSLRVGVFVMRHLAEVVELHLTPSRGNRARCARRPLAARWAADGRTRRARRASPGARASDAARRGSPARPGPPYPTR